MSVPSMDRMNELAPGELPDAINIEALTKKYGDFTAVKELNLRVHHGEVFGFLGPNGAGKTTTIRILMGILVPSSGRVMIAGLDCLNDRVELKRQVGYLPDTPVFYDYLRGRELLRFVGEMHGLPEDVLATRQAELLSRLSIDDAADDYAVNYSAGMKKKLALACALIHNPSVLILDEPTNGLDPIASRQIQEMIRNSAAEGRTVFLSTHLLDMAQKLCHRVGIINKAQLRAVGTTAALSSALAPGGSLEDVFFAVTDSAAESQ